MYSFPKNTGFIPNPFDPRDVWEDELGGEPILPLPKTYRTEGLLFEPQGRWPFCVSFSVTKLFELQMRLKFGIVKEFSPAHLFFHSGGGPNGSYFRSNLETACKSGCVRYGRVPMPSDVWGERPTFEMFQKEALANNFDGAEKIPGYIRINPDKDSIKRAIQKYKAVMVGVAGNNGYWKDCARRAKGAVDNHACLWLGWDTDDAMWGFDSLQPYDGFDGYHTFAPDYEVASVYAVTELPDDWKEKREEARKLPEGNAERYGKPRDFGAEVKFAAQMLAEFKRFNNQSVLEAAGRFWEMYIRAGVYGGYSLSYPKWGLWQPGDIINDCYYWRRTGNHIFDFDKTRLEN